MSTPENPPLEPPENHESQEELLRLPIDLTDTDVDPEAFKRTLIARQAEIIESINRAYEKALEDFPGYDDSVMPAAVVAVISRRVGFRYKNVIEPQAYWANKTGGIFYEMGDLKPKFHPYWIAVAESGFVPELRMKGSFQDYSTAELGARIPGTGA
jgi:hypothetical protein